MIVDLLVGGLATWRLTHLFLYESGPFRVFRIAREKLGVSYNRFSPNTIDSYKWELTTCPYCLSMWVAAGVTVLLQHKWGTRILMPYSLSAVAIAMHKALGKG